jgi:stage V sporulation protein D (sporulation-specific penicillin-binding protein)
VRRIRLVKAAFSLIAAAVLVRLFYWQVVKAEELLTQAEAQHWEVLTAPARRGEILASDGFRLAGNQPAYLVYAQPRKIEDLTKTSKALADVLEDDEASISGRLKPDLLFVPVARKIDQAIKNRIQALGLPGLGFKSEEKRFYPEGSMAANLLGFVGSDASLNDKGYFGLEGYYEAELRGLPGQLRQEKDALNQPIPWGRLVEIPPVDGRNLILTIDRALQFFVEKELKSAVERYGAKRGTVTVMEPQTGSILAMAVYPGYHPGEWELFSQELIRNPTVADIYEPGSTFKVVTMAAGLDSGVVKPETRCTACSGPLEVGGETIRTWNDEYFPDTTMIEVLEHSDNVGIAFVAQRLSLNRFWRYLEAFGFGERTGIDLQEEEAAKLREKKDWRLIDLATAGFGQGIAITRIQMLRAVATVANGGKLVRPYLVEKIVSPEREIKIEPQVIRQVIKPETAKVLTEMLVAAVDNGEARTFKPEGFTIAGKTGTAQIPIAGHYDPHKTIASFVGFAPVDEPRFVMSVTLQEPTASPWGSETAAPTFFKIVQGLFAYYGIHPGR